MTLTLVFGLALLALASVLVVIRGRAGAVQTAAEVTDRLWAFDAEAFQNLTSITELEFLRSNLPLSEFRKVQRRRLWVAMKYVNLACDNAAAILRYGETSSKASQDDIKAAGQELARNAIRLRMLAFPVRLKLCACIIAPELTISWFSFLHSYEEMSVSVRHIGQLRSATHSA
jgi:hypothetical protein